LDWNDASNGLFAMQHGRDQLSQFWGDLYDAKENAELPSEEFFQISEGDDFGWPYCYFDHLKDKKILTPEYGGDGETQGRCEGVKRPIKGFPGHLAPNDLLFYTGEMFPEKYKNGAFIAFHGSWNRSPEPQQGYYVVFVPMNEKGEIMGDSEVFATGFAGTENIASPSDAEHRPTGLAQGADGALYVSDSKTGRIYRIAYE
jgi:glucose/arabinose dehydrogenase